MSATDPPTTAPATGSADHEKTVVTEEEEPTHNGTLFLMIVFLMLIFGFWAMMYLMLINR